MKTAIVIGSTGMVGTELIRLLLSSKHYGQVISLVRKSSGITNKKLTEHIVDFENIDNWSHLITGDVLFSCMGTTLADAGSKEQQYKIDYTYQYNVAKAAAKNSVSHYVLISSAGANSKSKIFYSKIKGELEDAVKRLAFQVIIILQPGQLYGERKTKRKGEKIALKVMFFLNKMRLFRKYHPIHSHELAKAMINLANTKFSTTYKLTDLFHHVY